MPRFDCELCPVSFPVRGPDEGSIEERLAEQVSMISLHYLSEHPDQGVQLVVVLDG